MTRSGDGKSAEVLGGGFADVHSSEEGITPSDHSFIHFHRVEISPRSFFSIPLAFKPCFVRPYTELIYCVRATCRNFAPTHIVPASIELRFNSSSHSSPFNSLDPVELNS